MWDVVRNESRHTLRGHGLAVFGMAFLEGPDGAAVGYGGGRPTGPDLGHRGRGHLCGCRKATRELLHVVAVRPDGRQIATGGGDGVV